MMTCDKNGRATERRGDINFLAQHHRNIVANHIAHDPTKSGGHHAHQHRHRVRNPERQGFLRTQYREQ